MVGCSPQAVGIGATWSEADRLAALRDYDILDTLPERAFDDLAKLAGQVCDTPIAVVNFIESTRQWFKAEVGLGLRETPLDISFCAHALLQKGLFVVPDTTQDARFSANPLVTGAPHFRFYAGALFGNHRGPAARHVVRSRLSAPTPGLNAGTR